MALTTSRYRVGCAGQFMLGQDTGFDDLDEALVFAGRTPGAFVYGPRGEADECFGPFDQEQADEARARLCDRRVVEWAARELGALSVDDEVPADGYDVPTVYRALARLGVEVPPPWTEITAESMRALALLAAAQVDARR